MGWRCYRFRPMTVPTSPNPQRWRTLAGLGAILASALAASACAVERPADGKPPAIVLDQVTLRHYAADGTVREGHASEVTYYRSRGRLEGTDIDVNAPPTADLKRGGVQLAAKEGEADLKGHGARLFDGVTVRTGEGDVGTTEEAFWNGTTSVISGEQPIDVKGPGYTTTADGFAFEVPRQKLELRGDVRIHQTPAGEEAAK